MLTGLPDRSALHGVLAEIEGLGLDVVEVCQLTRTANHQDQVTPAHRARPGFGRTEPRYREGAAAMTSAPCVTTLADHLMTPKNAAFLLIDYQPAQLGAVRSMDHALLATERTKPHRSSV